MKEGTCIFIGDKTQNMNLLNVTHNLKITQECLKYLLNIVKSAIEAPDGGKKNFSGDEAEIDEIIELCKTNAELMGKLNELLIRGQSRDRVTYYAVNGLQKGCNSVRTEHYYETAVWRANHYNKNDLQLKFRESVVDLMIISLQCWEHCTQKGKIELAEESKIWRINIDGGRLRVRSMDRYLSVEKLPKIPRWRDVLKTAYFVLDRVDSNSSIKKKLEESIEQTLEYMRMKAH